MTNTSGGGSGGYGSPGWYIYDVIGAPMTARYAASPADFQKRYGAPPMPSQWYATKAEADNAIAGNFQGEPAALQQTNPAKAVSTALSNTTVGKFLAKLGSANLWLRVAEVALGLVLIAIGVARLTHAVPIATDIAKTVGAVSI